MSILILIAFLLLAFWFFVVLPQRRRQRTHTAMQDSLAAGDEVITAGGLHGEVVGIENSVVSLEIAPETVVRVDRRAIAARIEPEDHEAEEEEEQEPVESPEEPERAESGSAGDPDAG